MLRGAAKLDLILEWKAAIKQIITEAEATFGSEAQPLCMAELAALDAADRLAKTEQKGSIR